MTAKRPPSTRVTFLDADGIEVSGSPWGRGPKIRRHHSEAWLVDDRGPRDEWRLVLVAKRHGSKDPLPRELARLRPDQRIELVPDVFDTDEIVIRG